MFRERRPTCKAPAGLPGLARRLSVGSVLLLGIAWPLEGRRRLLPLLHWRRLHPRSRRQTRHLRWRCPQAASGGFCQWHCTWVGCCIRLYISLEET